MSTLTLTPKQLKVLTLVRHWRDSRGYSPTMQELADELGVSKVTVFEHVEALVAKGALTRDANKARSLAITPRAGAITPRADDAEPRTLSADFRHGDNAADGFAVPLVGRIAAGYPIERLQEEESLRLDEVFGTVRGRRGNMFALQVEGMSMRDEGILDGDYVIVEQRNTARNGERVVALLPNGETTLKTLYREKDGTIRLQPANPEFQPIIVRDCAVQGVVIGVLRRY